MSRLPRILLVACLLSSSCGLGGRRVINAYPGPTRAEEQLTTLDVEVNTGVMIDDNNRFQCTSKSPEAKCRFLLVPGTHKLLIWYADENTRSKDARPFKLNMPAGRSYEISASPVLTLDDWAVFVFNTTDEHSRLIYSDRDQHCKACPPIQ